MERELLKIKNNLIMEQVSATLKENNIPFVKKYEGATSYMNIMGYSKQECRIIVSEEDYNKAMKLVSVFFEDTDNIDENSEETSTDKELSKTKMLSKILVWFTIMFPVILIVCFMVFDAINN